MSINRVSAQQIAISKSYFIRIFSNSFLLLILQLTDITFHLLGIHIVLMAYVFQPNLFYEYILALIYYIVNSFF